MAEIWRWFADGILQHIVFYLLLLISGLIVIITAVCEELDRYLARLEKGLISLFMLVMVGLSFLDYMRRELSFFDFEIDGGPNMAVVLMVWVGFLGASPCGQTKEASCSRRHRSNPVTRSRTVGKKIHCPDSRSILLEVWWLCHGPHYGLSSNRCWTRCAPIVGQSERSSELGGQTLLPIEQTSGLTILLWSAVILALLRDEGFAEINPQTYGKSDSLKDFGGMLVLLGGLEFALMALESHGRSRQH